MCRPDVMLEDQMEVVSMQKIPIHREEGKFEDSVGLCEDPAMVKEKKDVIKRRGKGWEKEKHQKVRPKKSTRKNGIKENWK